MCVVGAMSRRNLVLFPTATVADDSNTNGDGEMHGDAPIFIGGWGAVQSMDPLLSRGITHVLCRKSGHLLPGARSRLLSSVRLWTSRRRACRSAAALPPMQFFIRTALDSNSNAKVLVHCWAGQSRSAAVICAWLLASTKGWQPKIWPPNGCVLQRRVQCLSVWRNCAVQSGAEPNAASCSNCAGGRTHSSRDRRTQAELAYRVFKIELVRRNWLMMLEVLEDPETSEIAETHIDQPVMLMMERVRMLARVSRLPAYSLRQIM